MDSINKLIQIRLDIYIYINYIYTYKLYIYRTRAPVRAICFLSVFQEQLVETLVWSMEMGNRLATLDSQLDLTLSKNDAKSVNPIVSKDSKETVKLA